MLRRKPDDFRAEIEAHIALEADRLREQGLSPEEAQAAARRRFGNVTRAREVFYESRRWMWWDHLKQDLMFGLRMLGKSRGFTAVAVLSLALGVGANTAIFSIVNAVLLRALSFREPGRLVRIGFDEPGIGLRNVTFSVPELDDLRSRAGVFEEVSGVGGGSINLTGASHPERLEFVGASSNYFSMLGASPQLGRLFGRQDARLGFATVAVISDGLWRRSYGADPSVIGRSVRLDNDAYTIIGVLPPGFRHPGPTISGNADIWLTTEFSGDPSPQPARSTRILAGAIGRLKPGITLSQAQAQLTAMAVQLRREFPADYPAQAQWTIEIQPLRESLVGSVRPMLLVLLGAVTLIVLVVALNLANLLLARASGRQQEMAVRLALGATRGRMLRQMLTESLLLAMIGGAAGIAVARSALGLIVRLVPANVPRLDEVSMDWRVLGFALAVSLLTGLVFGLAPALHGANVSPAIREGSRGSGHGSRTARLRDVLIVSELAFAVVLMVGAGLLLRTLRDLLRENPGFNPTQVVTARVWLPVPNNPKADPYVGNGPKNVFDRQLLRNLRAVPGIRLAALTSNLPTIAQSDRRNYAQLVIEDRPNESSEDLHAERIRVTPDYFQVLQAPLARGRSFTESDEDGKPAVAIIDESTARRFWRDRDPLGRRLRFGQGPAPSWLTVVGVVKDIKHDGLDVDGVPHIYVPLYQTGDRQLGVVLRTSLPAAAIEDSIRQAVQSIDPGLPVFGVSSMNDVLDRSLASRRFSADLVSGFAGMALLLASFGIYGLLSYMVGQRSREIGVRMALGASRASVLRLFLRRAAILTAIGVGSGVAVSASTASILANLLYGVRPHDATVFVVVPAVLMVVSLLAGFLPARRATKVNPIIALREV